MEKKNIIKYFEIRQSLMVLFARLLLTEIIITIGYVLAKWGYLYAVGENAINSVDNTTWIYILFQLINLTTIMIVVVLWAFHFYRISQETISRYKGYINKKTDIITMRTISSVKMSQGLMGRIFGFGTIRVECMFSKQVIFLKNINKPHFYRKAIQNMISDAIRQNPVSNQMQNV